MVGIVENMFGGECWDLLENSGSVISGSERVKVPLRSVFSGAHAFHFNGASESRVKAKL